MIVLHIIGFLVVSTLFSFALACGYYATVIRSGWEFLDCITFSMMLGVYIWLEMELFISIFVDYIV